MWLLALSCAPAQGQVWGSPGESGLASKWARGRQLAASRVSSCGIPVGLMGLGEPRTPCESHGGHVPASFSRCPEPWAVEDTELGENKFVVLTSALLWPRHRQWTPLVFLALCPGLAGAAESKQSSPAGQRWVWMPSRVLTTGSPGSAYVTFVKSG